MSRRLITALGMASLATSGLAESLRSISADSAPAPTRNGGQRRTVAQAKRRAAKSRNVRRAKRLGHY